MAQQLISGIVRRIAEFGENTEYEGSLHIDLDFYRPQTNLKDRSCLPQTANTISTIRLTVWNTVGILSKLLKDYPVGEQLTVQIDDVIMRKNDNGGWYYNANALLAFEPEEGEELKGPDMSKLTAPAMVQNGALPL